MSQTANAYPPEWDEIGEAAAPPSKRWTPQAKARAYAKMRDLRDKLEDVMGGECARCHSTENLEFHHPTGRDWEPRQKNRLQRMRLYWRDFRAGLLQLLCASCNRSDGAARAVYYWQRKRHKMRGRR